MRTDAILLFTSGPEYGEVVSEMQGYDFYHASLSEEEYRRLLRQYGFRVIVHSLRDKECGDHTVWLARKIS